VLTFSVTIPAYNEELGIADVLARTTKACSSLAIHVPGVDSFEVIVVDDGSRDATASIVGRFPGVKLIQHPKNRGYGAALKTGFVAARGDYIAFLDADGTYPPESLPALLRTAIETGADMVTGSRMAGGRSGMPVVRKMGNLAFALLLSWLADVKIRDTASGMRVVKRASLDRLHPLPDGLDLTPAMSTIAHHERLKVIEVPIPYEERAGRSKLSLVKDGARFLRTILSLAETYNPLKFFGGVGILLLGLAFLLGIGPVVHYLRLRTVPLSEIYRLLTILVLTVTGLNAISFGIAANHFVALLRGRAAAYHWLSKLARPERLRRLAPLGLILMAAAILLNGQAIYNYLTTLHVGLHWSYVLTGAFLFLTGAHLLMIGRLVRIFELLRANAGSPQGDCPPESPPQRRGGNGRADPGRDG
jgi:glycosyltransferase involved in cell wall biosynthesis